MYFFSLKKVTLTVENFVELTAQLTSVVRNASDEMDQTAENINVIAQVFTLTADLLEGGAIAVDETVRVLLCGVWLDQRYWASIRSGKILV